MALPALAALTGLVATIIALLGAPPRAFVPGACGRAEAYLQERVVGQEAALGTLVDALCRHLANPHPRKPLVISAHGPPGVGKTLTHALLARALYSAKPHEAAASCPGPGCPAYTVLYGLDYVRAERAAQLASLRGELLRHVQENAEPLLVVEEYDKMDCEARGLLRQLLTHPEATNRYGIFPPHSLF